MMACIYTNTQTCTTAEHTCTNTVYMQTCACAWIRYGSDPTTVTKRWVLAARWTLAGPKKTKKSKKQKRTVWFIISEVHWESWWDCETVALFPFFYFSWYVLFLLLLWKPLYGIAVCNVTDICFVYLAFSSFTLLLKKKQLLFYCFSLFSVKWCLLSKQ